MLRGAHSLVGERVTVKVHSRWIEAKIKSYDDAILKGEIVTKPFELEPLYEDSACPKFVNLPAHNILFYKELQAQLRCQKAWSEPGFKDTRLITLRSLDLRPSSHYTADLISEIEKCSNEPLLGAKFSVFSDGAWRDGEIVDFEPSRAHKPFVAQLDNDDGFTFLDLPSPAVVYFYEVAEVLRFQMQAGDGKKISLHDLVTSLTQLCVRDEYPNSMLETISRCANEALGHNVVLVNIGEVNDSSQPASSASLERGTPVPDGATASVIRRFFFSDDGISSDVADAYIRNGVVQARIEYISRSTSASDEFPSRFRLSLIPWVSGGGGGERLKAVKVPGPPLTVPSSKMAFFTEVQHYLEYVQLVSQVASSGAPDDLQDHRDRLKSKLIQDVTRHNDDYDAVIDNVLPQFIHASFVGSNVFVHVDNVRDMALSRGTQFVPGVISAVKWSHSSHVEFEIVVHARTSGSGDQEKHPSTSTIETTRVIFSDDVVFESEVNFFLDNPSLPADQLSAELRNMMSHRRVFTSHLAQQIILCGQELTKQVVGKPVWIPCVRGMFFDARDSCLGNPIFTSVVNGRELSGVWMRGVVVKRSAKFAQVQVCDPRKQNKPRILKVSLALQPHTSRLGGAGKHKSGLLIFESELASIWGHPQDDVSTAHSLFVSMQLMRPFAQRPGDSQWTVIDRAEFASLTLALLKLVRSIEAALIPDSSSAASSDLVTATMAADFETVCSQIPSIERSFILQHRLGTTSEEHDTIAPPQLRGDDFAIIERAMVIAFAHYVLGANVLVDISHFSDTNVSTLWQKGHVVAWNEDHAKPSFSIRVNICDEPIETMLPSPHVLFFKEILSVLHTAAANDETQKQSPSSQALLSLNLRPWYGTALRREIAGQIPLLLGQQRLWRVCTKKGTDQLYLCHATIRVDLGSNKDALEIDSLLSNAHVSWSELTSLGKHADFLEEAVSTGLPGVPDCASHPTFAELLQPENYTDVLRTGAVFEAELRTSLELLHQSLADDNASSISDQTLIIGLQRDGLRPRSHYNAQLASLVTRTLALVLLDQDVMSVSSGGAAKLSTIAMSQLSPCNNSAASRLKFVHGHGSLVDSVIDPATVFLRQEVLFLVALTEKLNKAHSHDSVKLSAADMREFEAIRPGWWFCVYDSERRASLITKCLRRRFLDTSFVAVQSHDHSWKLSNIVRCITPPGSKDASNAPMLHPFVVGHGDTAIVTHLPSSSVIFDFEIQCARDLNHEEGVANLPSNSWTSCLRSDAGTNVVSTLLSRWPRPLLRGGVPVARVVQKSDQTQLTFTVRPVEANELTGVILQPEFRAWLKLHNVVGDAEQWQQRVATCGQQLVAMCLRPAEQYTGAILGTLLQTALEIHFQGRSVFVADGDEWAEAKLVYKPGAVTTENPNSTWCFAPPILSVVSAQSRVNISLQDTSFFFSDEIEVLLQYQADLERIGNDRSCTALLDRLRMLNLRCPSAYDAKMLSLLYQCGFEGYSGLNVFISSLTSLSSRSTSKQRRIQTGGDLGRISPLRWRAATVSRRARSDVPCSLDWLVNKSSSDRADGPSSLSVNDASAPVQLPSGFIENCVDSDSVERLQRFAALVCNRFLRPHATNSKWIHQCAKFSVPSNVLLPQRNIVFEFEVRSFLKLAAETATFDEIASELASLALRSRSEYTLSFLFEVAELAISRFYFAANASSSCLSSTIDLNRRVNDRIARDQELCVLAPRQVFYLQSNPRQWVYASIHCPFMERENDITESQMSEAMLRQLWKFQVVPVAEFYSWVPSQAKSSRRSTGVSTPSFEYIDLPRFPSPNVFFVEELLAFNALSSKCDDDGTVLERALQQVLFRGTYGADEVRTLKELSRSSISSLVEQFQSNYAETRTHVRGENPTTNDTVLEDQQSSQSKRPRRRGGSSDSVSPKCVLGPSVVDSADAFDAKIYNKKNVAVFVPNLEDPSVFSWAEGEILSVTPKDGFSATVTISFGQEQVWCQAGDAHFIQAAKRCVADLNGTSVPNKHASNSRRQKRKPRAPGDLVHVLEFTLPDPRVLFYEELRHFLKELDHAVADNRSTQVLVQAVSVVNMRPRASYDADLLDMICSCTASGLRGLEVFVNVEGRWERAHVTDVEDFSVASYRSGARIVSIEVDTDGRVVQAQLDDPNVVYEEEVKTLVKHRGKSGNHGPLLVQSLLDLAVRGAYDEVMISRLSEVADATSKARAGPARTTVRRKQGDEPKASSSRDVHSRDASPHKRQRKTKSQTPGPPGSVIDLTSSRGWDTNLDSTLDSSIEMDHLDDVDLDEGIDVASSSNGMSITAGDMPSMAGADTLSSEESDLEQADFSDDGNQEISSWWARAKNYLLQKLTFGALPEDIDQVPLVHVESQRSQLELLVSGVLLPRQVQRGATRNQNALVLLLGPPGTGKSLVVESVLHGFRSGSRPALNSSAQRADHGQGISMSNSSTTMTSGCRFKTVYLDGLLARTDEEAIGEICEQLSSGSLDRRSSKVLAHAKGEHQLRFLVDTIKNAADQGFAIVIVMRRFERFTARRKQTLLYNLFDLTQDPKVRVAVVGISAVQNVTDFLEKRIQSRFSHREVLFTKPTFEGEEGALDIMKSMLRLGPSTRKESFSLAQQVDAFVSDTDCKRILRRQYLCGRSLVWFQRVFALMISSIRSEDVASFSVASSPDLNTSSPPRIFDRTRLERAVDRLSIDPLRMMIGDMSAPELLMLIAVRHCNQAAISSGTAVGAGACLFKHAYSEYERFLKQEESKGSFSASMENFTEDVLYRSYSRLVDLGIFRPLTGTGLGDARGATGSRMRKSSHGRQVFSGTFGTGVDFRSTPVGLGYLAFDVDTVLRSMSSIPENIRKWSREAR